MRITVPFPRTRDRSGVKQPALLRQRWLLLPIILVIITAIVLWRLYASATTTTMATATVSQGNLTITVSGSGAVAAARQIELPFQQSGTVTAVNVKVGDQVKAGQVLAQIDAGDLQLQLQQAQANLKAQQAKLAQIKDGSATPQDMTSAQAALDSAKAQLQQTKTGTASAADIQSAQAQLDAARARLNALKNPTSADLNAAQSKVDQAQIALQSTRNSASQAKTNAQLALQNAVDVLTQAQSKYATAQSNWQHVQDSGTDPTKPNTTNAAGQKVPNKLNSAQRQQYYDAFVQAQTALNSAQNGVTQAQVAYDAARQKEITDVAQAEAASKDAQRSLDVLMNPSAADLTQAQAEVTQAQANLDKLRQGGTVADITKAQAAVTQAQANLDKLTAPATSADLAAAEASVLQAEADVATAQRNLEQATLTAPFDGVVAAVGVQVGGNSTSGDSSSTSTASAAITLVDRSKLHIAVNLSEADTAKVQVGQPVSLTFDALPNVRLQGTVATVAPAATVSQNVVTFPVQIEFDPGTTPVKVGMSAAADIQVQQVNNAILVPSRAMQTAGNGRTVTVLQGPQRVPVTVRVETGATSNGQTTITSCVDTGAQCLRPGDVVAILGAPTGSASSQSGQRGGFGPRGGFGGFGDGH